MPVPHPDFKIDANNGTIGSNVMKSMSISLTDSSNVQTVPHHYVGLVRVDNYTTNDRSFTYRNMTVPVPQRSSIVYLISDDKQIQVISTK
mgnify:CR=1 FL=1